MFDIIKEILTSPFGSFSFVLGIILGAFWLVHYVTKRVTEITASHGSLAKQTEKMESNIDEIRRDLSYMKGSMDVFKSGGGSTVQSHSPISLTELGNKVSQQLNAEEVVTRNWDKIFKDLEAHICDKNAYDIQTYCLETAAVEPERFFDPQAMTAIKNLAFQEGKPFQYYSNVFGVLIRDRYLKAKGISHTEIDANDPTIKKQ